MEPRRQPVVMRLKLCGHHDLPKTFFFAQPEKKKNYYKKPSFWIINWTNISSNSKFPTNLCRMSFFLISFEQKNWRKQLLAHKSESFCFNIFCSNGKIHFFWRENQNLLEYWVLDKNYLYKLRLLTCFDRKWLNLPSWMFWEVQ
jgi:hypothetical protein